jgi:Flp pilus assembly protein protease CpaA
MRRPSRQGLLLVCTFCTGTLVIALCYTDNSEQAFPASPRTSRNTISFFVAISTPAVATLPPRKLLARKILSV